MYFKNCKQVAAHCQYKHDQGIILRLLKLQVIGSEKSKVQHYLNIRPVVELDSYAPDAYLQAVGGWKERQAGAQSCTGWLAVDGV